MRLVHAPAFPSSAASFRSVITSAVALLALVTCASAQRLEVAVNRRTVSPGESLTHTLTLRDGSRPLADRTISIDDPVRQVCTTVKTNASGVATYTTPTSGSTAPAVYVFRFAHGASSTSSSVAITIPSPTATLPGFSLNLGSSQTPQSSTACIARTMPGGAARPSASQRAHEMIRFGGAVAKEYLSNPGSAALTVITAVSCAAVPLSHGVTAPVCIKGAVMVAQGAVMTAIRLQARDAIARSTMTSRQKDLWLKAIDAGTVVYALMELGPDGSLIGAVSQFETGWDAATTLVQTIDEGQGIAMSKARADGGTRMLAMRLR